MKINFLALFLFLSMCVLNSSNAQTLSGSNSKKILVAYYSHSFGNTRAVAEQIHKAVGGDIFEIVLVKPYPNDDKEVIDMVREEMKAGYRPEIKDKVAAMDSYDIVFIGTPIWFSTVASPVFTFLESYDFSGKTIIPFYTCGGGTEGTTVEDMKKACPKTTFLPIFGVSKKDRENGTGAQQVDDYLKKLQL